MKKRIFFGACALSALLLTSPAAAAAKEKDIQVKINQQAVKFPDAKPIINEDNRTLVPIRFVAESMGATVEWTSDDKTVLIRHNGAIMEIKIGEAKVKIYDVGIKPLDTKAILKGNRAYVPYRFLAETFGAEVTWSQEERTIYVSTQRFREPKISVAEPEDKTSAQYQYFTLCLDNYYQFGKDYRMKFECTNYPQLNTIECPVAENTWATGSMSGWQSCSREIFKLTRKYYTTRENEKTLKIKDGMEIRYVVTIQQKSTGVEKKYPGVAVVKDKK